MSGLSAPGFPEAQVRRRAAIGPAAVFPPGESYGSTVFGMGSTTDPGASRAGGSDPGADPLDALRLAPPVFMPLRLEKLIELGREPLHTDVDIRTNIGGFASTMPLYLSAFGSTRAASSDLGLAASRQAGRLGIPMVIGENIVSMNGYHVAGPEGAESAHGLLDRISAYADSMTGAAGGVIVQQCTDDADLEVWNQVYSDPRVQPLLRAGRLGFELKIGQGAKPGIGGMTVLGERAAAQASTQYIVEPLPGLAAGSFLRSASPGTFTAEILNRQIRLMRNNFPGVRVWVKLFPGRDVADAATVAWKAGADAVCVDGAEGGTGWAPTVLVEQAGLPLGECLIELRGYTSPLLVSGRMWEGGRVVKCLALGATAAGLGRAALIAVDEDPQEGLMRLAASIALELRLLISALGKYRIDQVSREDLWVPRGLRDAVTVAPRTLDARSDGTASLI